MVAEKLKLEVIDTRSPLTIAQVHGAIRQYRQEHGQFPDPGVRLHSRVENNLEGAGPRPAWREPGATEVVADARSCHCDKAPGGDSPEALQTGNQPVANSRGHCDSSAADGAFPTVKSGRSRELDSDWRSVNMALSQGLRGLPGGSSLSQEVAKIKRE